MQAALKLNATVLPGHRIEVTAPDLPEGAQVELIVMLADEETSRPRQYVPALDLLDSLPPGPRSAATWEDVERQFQEERDAWDR